MEDDFPVGQLKLNINPNKALRSYRVKDFPEVDCIGIMDSVRHDEDADRYVVIALTELTKEGTLSAIKTLEQREDVLSVNPVTEEYMDALLVGAYDFRSDVEDNKEFIFGEILITLYPSASRKTYTKEDFSDVNCIELKQDYWSHINTYDMTVILEDKTREGTIAAAEKLTEREDIRIISFNHEGDLDNATTD
ncbi:MAG: hypothetical protein IIY12_06295 [Clostridia bacterium]|nr:hypothetical protein [Clostridia bacterium]